MKNFQKPILVTGSHRSGTTWVGKVIASSASIGYIHEPFGLNFGKEICGANFQYWFEFVCDQNESKYLNDFRDTLNFHHDLGACLRASKSWRSKFRATKQHLLFRRYKLANARPLIKDPIALFSAEWIHSRFNADVIVMIRHPAAFVNSIKQIGWEHPFSHFLEQDLLIKDHLNPFKNDIRKAAQNKLDPIDQAILVWKLTHHVILKFMSDHPDCSFIRHEDISIDPIGRFELIFNKLDLEFGERERAAVERYSFNQSNKSPSPWDIRRNSYNNLYAWKERLTDVEIARIKSQVSGISNQLYAQEEW